MKPMKLKTQFAGAIQELAFVTLSVLSISAMAMLTMGEVHAADLKAPFEGETSKVLPKGIRNPRFKNLTMIVDDKFDSEGVAKPLGAKLNKTVSWQDLKDAQPTVEDKAKIDGIVQAAGIQGVGPGATTGAVKTAANVMVPVLAMGITDKFTAAVAVPIMNVKVDTATGFVKSADGQKFIDEATKANTFKGVEAQTKLNDAINQKTTRLGYSEGVTDKTVKGVGDIKVVGKYLAYSDEDNAIGIKGDVTLPTGIKPNADKVIDVPTGDGQWDIGASAIYDRKLVEGLNFNAYSGYTVQLSDRLERRLPTSATDSLSADKEMLDRNLGDVFSTGTSLAYTFDGVGLTLMSGYNYQYMAQTTYSRGTFAEERYKLLEAEMPLQSIHAGTVGLGVSTVEFFKQKRFPLPLQGNLTFSHPFAGRNVTTNNVVMAEFVMFF